MKKKLPKFDRQAVFDAVDKSNKRFDKYSKKQRKKFSMKAKKGVETDFTGLPMNPFDADNWE